MKMPHRAVGATHRVALLFFAGVGAAYADGKPLTLRIEPEKVDRRFVVPVYTSGGVFDVKSVAPPYRLKEKESGRDVPCEWGYIGSFGAHLYWLIPYLPAGESRTYILEHVDKLDPDYKQSTPFKPEEGVVLEKTTAEEVMIRVHKREVTRYHFGPVGEGFRRPYFYPLIGPGDVGITRGYPMVERPGEEKDHPHHTSFFFAHGDVNGANFWMGSTVKPKESPEVLSGPVFGSLFSENLWSKDKEAILTERQSFSVLNVAPEIVMDCEIDLSAENAPVVFGQTKEGGFAIRVATGLTEKAGATMLDSEGRHGEKEIWSKTAAWVDYSGTVDGKKVGVTIMNHPKSYGFPTTWHARGYGLFSANPFMNKAETIPKETGITLRYRVYVHSGNANEGKVAEVYNGYAIPAKVTVEK